MSSLKKYNKLVYLLIIVAFPPVVYYLMSLGTHNYKPLPIIGQRKFTEKEGKTDTLYHTLTDFKLLDQDSNEISLDYAKGKILIANFFFATCPKICPKMITNMKYLNEKINDPKKVVFMSFSVNPKEDTPSKLKAYAKKAHLNEANWRLITGKKETIYDLAINSFLVPVEDKNSDFIHSEKLILIDNKKRIRGFFDGTIHKEIKQNMIDAIDILLKEDFVPLKGKKREEIIYKRKA